MLSRKIKIWFISIVVVLVLFLVYNLVSNTPQIKPDEFTGESQELDIPHIDRNSPTFSGATIAQTDVSEYVEYDEDTKKVSRVFGFEKLLNPETKTSRWKLLRPYMQMFQNDLVYRIVSNTGDVAVETVAGRPNPTDARLEGDVRITIRNQQDDKLLSTIYLDDLRYSNQRSEFSTDGPVKIESKDADMEGQGLLLIYNAMASRVELLNIKDLHYVNMRNVQGLGSEDEDQKTALNKQAINKSSDGEAVSIQKEVSETAGDDNFEQDYPVDDPNVFADAALEPDKTYYKCTLRDDVRIQVGNELVVSGSDQVTIMNILSDQGKPDSMEGKGESQNQTISTAKPDNTASETSGKASLDDNDNKDSVEDNNRREVYVTCEGGILIVPIDSAYSERAQDGPLPTTMMFSGAPVRIEQPGSGMNSEQDFDSKTLATCGELEYNADNDVMQMHTNERQKYVSIHMTDSDAGIHTRGSVYWDRRKSKARVYGPGRLYTNKEQSQKNKDDNSAVMNFRGMMDLIFAESDSETLNGHLALDIVDLVGGMNAHIEQENLAYISSDSARFNFKQENQLDRADLSGNFRFIVSEQNGSRSDVSADKAKLYFNQGNELIRADISGNVNFSSNAYDDSPAQIRARVANLLFGDNSLLAQADMEGDVKFDSIKGSLKSQRAKILFAQDDFTGKTYPMRLLSSENPVMEPVSDDQQKPARFTATKIDYDILTGNALAHGPVTLLFYNSPQDEEYSFDNQTPIVITSEGDARFYSRNNRAVFNRDVVGKRTVDNETFIEQSSFYGDKMVVSLSDDRKLRHVTITGSNVKLESIRTDTVANTKLSHVTLYCERLDYDDPKSVIVAQGPGKIEIDNSKLPVPDEDVGRFSFKKPCYARIEGYEKLKWYFGSQMITAAGKDRSIFISYLPVVEGQENSLVYASTNDLRIHYTQLPKGKTELDDLTASGGITYNEKGGHELIGDYLYYDHDQSQVTVSAEPPNTCVLDGAFVESVLLNLDTGKVKTNIPTAPGAIPINR